MWPSHTSAHLFLEFIPPISPFLLQLYRDANTGKKKKASLIQISLYSMKGKKNTNIKHDTAKSQYMINMPARQEVHTDK